MSAKFTMALAGAEQLTRALKLAVPSIAANVKKVVKRRTPEIAAKAKAAAPKVTGEMASTIRAEYSADELTGFVRVGLGTLPRRSRAVTTKGAKRAKGRRRTVGLGAYAPVVERGDPRRHHKAHPFLGPSFESDKPAVVSDMQDALNDTVQSI